MDESPQHRIFFFWKVDAGLVSFTIKLKAANMDIETMINSIEELPPAPRILPKLQRLLRDENSGIHDIISLLKVDVSMTARIVRISNSAFFGAREPSQSLEEAVTRMGFGEVYKVVSMAAAQQVLAQPAPLYEMKQGQLLDQSISCAVMMVEGIARHLRRSLDAAYTVGLLHAIGKVVINEYYMNHGIDLYETEDGKVAAFDEAMERKVLGFDNAEVGAGLLRKWGFPEDICEPIAYQLKPLEAPSHTEFSAMLALSRDALPFVQQRPGSPIADFAGEPALLERTGLTPDDWIDCVANAREGLEEIQGFIK
jgi:HD-like signal output (HDOD) protein